MNIANNTAVGLAARRRSVERPTFQAIVERLELRYLLNADPLVGHGAIDTGLAGVGVASGVVRPPASYYLANPPSWLARTESVAASAQRQNTVQAIPPVNGFVQPDFAHQATRNVADAQRLEPMAPEQFAQEVDQVLEVIPQAEVFPDSFASELLKGVPALN